VLAEGILRFRVKREIRDEWDEARTLVISEFGPNLPWSVNHAMQRNRTICGLSRAMLLIEARITGGSIQAGRDCLRLGLPLFAAVYEGAGIGDGQRGVIGPRCQSHDEKSLDRPSEYSPNS